jgi:hypothetical protein
MKLNLRRFFSVFLPLLATLGIFSSAFAQEGGDAAKTLNYLVSTKGHFYHFQQIGTFTYFVCAKKDSSDDCQKIQAMNLQASVDWDGLMSQAKKESLKNPDGVLAKETFVDQYGGPWKVEMRIAKASDAPQNFLKPFHASVKAAFFGYQVTQSLSGDILSAQVLLNQSEWAAAKKALGLTPVKKKKFSFGDLFR